MKKRLTRIDKDTYYLDIAKAVCRRSTCLRRRYGCVIVKNDVIVSTGYNGSPRGHENCCDVGTCMRAHAQRYTGYETCPSVHAEQNAIISASREQMLGATVYLYCEENTRFTDETDWPYEWQEDRAPSPCGICRHMLQNAGVARVVTREGDLSGFA